MGRIAPIISILILGLLSLTYADYHYASHEGTNEYPYTSWETGAHLIQDAINAAERGDTIYVGEGTWNDNVEIIDTCLALIGMGMGNTVLENYNSSIIRFYADSLLVEGFTFIGDWEVQGTAGVASFSQGFLNINNNYFTGHMGAVSPCKGYITNNIFYRNYSSFNTYALKDTLVFSNNTIINEYNSSNLILDLLSDSSQFHIRNNVFYAGIQQRRIFDLVFNDIEDSIFIYNNLFYRKINPPEYLTSYFGWSADVVHFFNNTVDGAPISEQDTLLAGICSEMIYDSTQTIDNNIVVNCKYGILNRRFFTANIRYCNLFNNVYNTWGQCEYIEGNIFTDPMLTDTIGFYLQAFSPAIDAGDPAILDPDGSRSDIGAYGGPYGEYYEYQDLPPRVPDNVMIEVSTTNDTIYLDWRYNTEADFNRYQLHKDTVDGFEPDIFNIIAQPETSLYIDTDFEIQGGYYYRIAAVDNQDNISDYSDQVGITFTGFDNLVGTNLPRAPVLHQNYPNPFNQNTIIRFYLPDIGYQPAEVQLYIYDVLGRLVRRLRDDRMYPGEHEITWDARDDSGTELTSGVYFIRLIVSRCELSKPRKLILMK